MNLARGRSGEIIKGEWVVFILLFLLMGGCKAEPRMETPQHAEVAPTEKVEYQEPFVHVVRFNGETLGSIARWYTGDAQNWIKIKNANSGLVPERILIGQSITIPAEIVVKRENMTKEFVTQELAQLKKAHPAALAPNDLSSGAKVSVDSEPSALITELPITTEKKPEQVTGENIEKVLLLEKKVETKDSSPKVDSELQTGASQDLRELEVFDDEPAKPIAETKPSIEGVKKTEAKEERFDEDAERDKLLRELLGGK